VPGLAAATRMWRCLRKNTSNRLFFRTIHRPGPPTDTGLRHGRYGRKLHRIYDGKLPGCICCESRRARAPVAVEDSGGKLRGLENDPSTGRQGEALVTGSRAEESAAGAWPCYSAQWRGSKGSFGLAIYIDTDRQAGQLFAAHRTTDTPVFEVWTELTLSTDSTRRCAALVAIVVAGVMGAH